MFKPKFKMEEHYKYKSEAEATAQQFRNSGIDVVVMKTSKSLYYPYEIVRVSKKKVKEVI
jgi:mevalonate kinase